MLGDRSAILQTVLRRLIQGLTASQAASHLPFHVTAVGVCVPLVIIKFCFKPAPKRNGFGPRPVSASDNDQNRRQNRRNVSLHRDLLWKRSGTGPPQILGVFPLSAAACLTGHNQVEAGNKSNQLAA